MFLFISCLLIAGTYADHFDFHAGSCLGSGGVTPSPNKAISVFLSDHWTLENYLGMCTSGIEKGNKCYNHCQNRCEATKGCYGIEFQNRATNQCTLMMAQIQNVAPNSKNKKAVCSRIYRNSNTKITPTPYGGAFSHRTKAACACQGMLSTLLVPSYKYPTYGKCQQDCVDRAFCKGVKYIETDRKCTLCSANPVMGVISKSNEVTCAYYFRHPYQWKGLNTTHTNKTNLPDQGSSGASSVSLNVSTLLVVVFASLFL